MDYHFLFALILLQTIGEENAKERNELRLDTAATPNRSSSFSIMFISQVARVVNLGSVLSLLFKISKRRKYYVSLKLFGQKLNSHVS